MAYTKTGYNPSPGSTYSMGGICGSGGYLELEVANTLLVGLV